MTTWGEVLAASEERLIWTFREQDIKLYGDNRRGFRVYPLQQLTLL